MESLQVDAEKGLIQSLSQARRIIPGRSHMDTGLDLSWSVHDGLSCDWAFKLWNVNSPSSATTLFERGSPWFLELLFKNVD